MYKEPVDRLTIGKVLISRIMVKSMYHYLSINYVVTLPCRLPLTRSLRP